MRRPLLAALACVAFGCGGGPTTAPVTGRVTLNGKPLSDAIVTFQPVSTGDDRKPGEGSFGRTDADGKYTLALSGAGTPGAVVGKHRVTVFPKMQSEKPKSDKSSYVTKDLVPARYNTETTLWCYVPAGGTAAANFALTSP